MKILPYIILCLVAGIMVGAFLGNNPPSPAGDIVEYYGITESIMRHGTIALRPEDQSNLSTVLHPEYFSNPGYYLRGTDGNRYPVHFIAYSLLLIPIRWVLTIVQLNPLLVFSVGNSIMLFSALAYIMRYALRSSWQRGVLLVAALTSPLISFLWWPGPDVFSMSLLLVALFLFYEDKPFAAASLTALASWQSQPLLVVTIGLLGYSCITHHGNTKTKSWLRLAALSTGIVAVGLIPYLYNYVLFGALTPWTILQDFWTRTYGFGLQNINLQKLFEQIFDLNIGVFWYAPILTIAGLYTLAIQSIQNTKTRWLTCMAIVALLAYQTNPAWHYGTAGYGPTRHALILIPFLIAAIIWHSKPKAVWMGLVALILVSQVYILSINNYIFPVFTNTLVHSPVARFVLDRWPALYNPTPEIFVDRTNHTDLDHPTTAIYSVNGICKKAYVLLPDLDRILQTCRSNGSSVQGSIVHPDRDGLYITYE